MKDIRRLYWDSGVFCSFFNAKTEPKNAKIAKSLLEEARAGRIEIVTSSFALVEVLKVDSKYPITEDKEKDLVLFFELPCIKLYVPDREVCARARYYVWRHGLKSKDALHAATAERAHAAARIDELQSWDKHFLNLNGKTPLPFPFTSPSLAQFLLDFPTQDDTENQAELPDCSEEEDASDINAASGLRDSDAGDASNAPAEL